MSDMPLTLARVQIPPLTPTIIRKNFLSRWLAPLLSAAILVAALWQLRGLDVRAMLHMVPRSPLFWTMLVMSSIVVEAVVVRLLTNDRMRPAFSAT